ncbi:unnamed protein product, partial [Heterotrigona itama]
EQREKREEENKNFVARTGGKKKTSGRKPTTEKRGAALSRPKSRSLGRVPPVQSRSPGLDEWRLQRRDSICHRSLRPEILDQIFRDPSVFCDEKSYD